MHRQWGDFLFRRSGIDDGQDHAPGSTVRPVEPFPNVVPCRSSISDLTALQIADNVIGGT